VQNAQPLKAQLLKKQLQKTQRSREQKLKGWLPSRRLQNVQLLKGQLLRRRLQIELKPRELLLNEQVLRLRYCVLLHHSSLESLDSVKVPLLPLRGVLPVRLTLRRTWCTTQRLCREAL
jgi:hypothetical protein